MVEKKTAIIAVAVVAILVVAAVLVVVASPDKESSTGLYTVKANVNKDCTGTPFYVGTDIGYFDAYDIDFQDQGALDYGLQPAALISGQDDIYDGHPITIINLLKAGVKVKGVVMSGYEPLDGDINKQHMHWLVDKTRNDGKVINSIADLLTLGHKPKVAVLAEGVCADLEVQVWLTSYGYDLSQFEIVVLSDPYQEAALQSGAIDVAVLHPPFYAAAEEHGDVTVIATSMDTLGQYAGVSLLVFTEKFISEHPDSVRQFIKAYKGAQRWSDDHQTEAGKLTADTIGLSSAVPHWFSYNGVITNADIQPWIDAMVEFGLISEGEFKASDLFTTEFSDLWTSPTTPELLNPFNSKTNESYKWFNTIVGDQYDSSAVDVDHSTHFVEDLEAVDATKPKAEQGTA
ncbi:MAG: ABC transporter substrate-binding protein [Candidatus Methanoplasma sp.]|jgi:ABC-type nitrate/sulfonate/bicarbonate transport system substrate-binding protein|nr:ABC transporter substrate-binding protein [Candidatus Methanoplasma sp.]